MLSSSGRCNLTKESVCPVTTQRHRIGYPYQRLLGRPLFFWAHVRLKAHRTLGFEPFQSIFRRQEARSSGCSNTKPFCGSVPKLACFCSHRVVRLDS
jgi:hypothetical protein